MLNEGVILQLYNATPHRARQRVENIEEMGWELVQHPPYSRDLAPSDFHLLGALKECLAGIKFDNNEDVQQHVLQFLRAADKVSNKRIAVRKVATPLRELTCHMGSHSATCHPA